MNPAGPRRCARALLVLVGITACSSATQQPIASPAAPAAASARGAPPRSEADVQFKSGRIPHHAQAVVIAGWAATHGARSDIRILSERIVVGQKDEIALMQYWLREHGEAVPAADATHMSMKMNGMQHDMLMPGMLNDAQLAQLDKARGAEFDRLFLQSMIGHHEGAITMVDELLGSTRAGQDDVVYRMASDVYADQTTEIERMKKMLATVPAGGSR
ncbi:MAG: DUF305 domain-containing protein [Polaromonas sp.]|nr:DUF305 domain-containing protein [Gemmatimonadaceae bacterium]